MKQFLLKTFNGMTYGLFATLIIGVIIEQFGHLVGISSITDPLAKVLKSLLGMGIGLGIGIALKKEGLKLVMGMIIGAISTSFIFNYQSLSQSAFEFNAGSTNPVTVFVVTIITYIIFDRLIQKKTPIDLILIPLLTVFLAFIVTLVFAFPLDYLMKLISSGIDSATRLQPILMSIVIAVSMGAILTSPISSAAIALSIHLSGVAAGAAVVGTTIQMVGFAVQSIRDNSVGNVLSIAFGTAKLQFKNVVKKPIIWLPTLITSALMGPLYYLIFKLESTEIGAGMGSSALVGQLQVLESMNYSNKAIIAVVSMFVVFPLVIFAIDSLFRSKNWIVNGDLHLDNDF